MSAGASEFTTRAGDSVRIGWIACLHNVQDLQQQPVSSCCRAGGHCDDEDSTAARLNEHMAQD